jgi:hypothetical protein
MFQREGTQQDTYRPNFMESFHNTREIPYVVLLTFKRLPSCPHITETFIAAASAGQFPPGTEIKTKKLYYVYFAFHRDTKLGT